MRRALLIGWLGLWTTLAGGAEPGYRPGVFLEGATVARAKALALDAAMLKGWYVAASAREHTLFETILEEPASPGPMDDRLPPERTLLRIRADFVATPAGVNAYLQAQEVWWQGESGEWSADVTDTYRGNLARALESLQKQWTAFYKQRPGSGVRPVAAPRVRVEPGVVSGPPVPNADAIRPLPTGDEPASVTVRPLPTGDESASATVRPLPTGDAPASVTVSPLPTGDGAAPVAIPAQPLVRATPLPPAEQAPVMPARYEVGVWAYYAEQYAREQGCEPGDLGAVLERETGTGEVHRVHCADGSSRLVRCDREQCRSGG